jgi:hypothetical protein
MHFLEREKKIWLSERLLHFKVGYSLIVLSKLTNFCLMFVIATSTSERSNYCKILSNYLRISWKSLILRSVKCHSSFYSAHNNIYDTSSFSILVVVWRFFHTKCWMLFLCDIIKIYQEIQQQKILKNVHFLCKNNIVNPLIM